MNRRKKNEVKSENENGTIEMYQLVLKCPLCGDEFCEAVFPNESKLKNSMEPNEKLKSYLDENARVFAYACDPKQWKSFTPIHRKDGFFHGSVSEIKRALVLVDQMLQESDSKDLKELRKKLLFID